jgi:hypothetical protein
VADGLYEAILERTLTGGNVLTGGDVVMGARPR